VAFSPKKAAFLVQKTLKSAIANAENNHNLRADRLVVKERSRANPPPSSGSPEGRGSAGPIRKRTSHIFITLPTKSKSSSGRKGCQIVS